MRKDRLAKKNYGGLKDRYFCFAEFPCANLLEAIVFISKRWDKCKLQKKSCAISKFPGQSLFFVYFSAGTFSLDFLCINFLKL